jgi:hypothetical protein
VGRVFASITRTNTDGRLSIRDLRQWYITFGRHALAAAAAAGREPETALSAPGGSSGDGASGDGVVVSVPVMRSLHVHLATTATKAMVGGGRRGSKDRAAAAAAAAKPLYPWEQGGAAAASASSASASAPASPSGGAARRQSTAPAAQQQQSQQPPQPPAVQFPTLPNGLLEFQVRLSPEEYAAVGRLRRAMDAEERYKRRMGEAQARAAARRGIAAPGGGLGGGFDGAGSVGGASEGVSALRTAEPYAEPLSRDAAALLSRNG